MKSKQQALQEYLEMGVEKADVAENVFGAITERNPSFKINNISLPLDSNNPFFILLNLLFSSLE